MSSKNGNDCNCHQSGNEAVRTVSEKAPSAGPSAAIGRPSFGPEAGYNILRNGRQRVLKGAGYSSQVSTVRATSSSLPSTGIGGSYQVKNDRGPPRQDPKTTPPSSSACQDSTPVVGEPNVGSLSVTNILEFVAANYGPNDAAASLVGQPVDLNNIPPYRDDGPFIQDAINNILLGQYFPYLPFSPYATTSKHGGGNSPRSIAPGGILYFPPGTYLCRSPLDVSPVQFTTDRKPVRSGITLEGAGVGSLTSGSQLIFAPTSPVDTPFIQGLSASSIGIRGLSILYHSSSTAQYSGALIAFDQNPCLVDWDSALIYIDDCVIGSLNGDPTAGALLSLNRTISVTVRNCHFSGAKIGIQGASTPAAQVFPNQDGSRKLTANSFSNVIRVENCDFNLCWQSAIWNPGQSWVISGCNFEGFPACGMEDAAYATAISFTGCWFADWHGDLRNHDGVDTHTLRVGGQIITLDDWPWIRGRFCGVHISGCYVAAPGTMWCMEFIASFGIAMFGNFIGDGAVEQPAIVFFGYASGEVSSIGITVQGNCFATKTIYGGIAGDPNTGTNHTDDFADYSIESNSTNMGRAI